MSELVIAEKSDLVGIADEVRQLTGQTKSLSLQEMQTGLKSIDNQPDWTQNDQTARDYVKNRPGGYTVNYPALNIEWDGVIGDRVSVEDANGIKLVKVSDETLKAKQLVGGTLSFKQDDMSDAMSITDREIDNLGNGNYFFGYGGGGFSINKAPANLVSSDTGAVVAVFPETGVYFVYVSNSTYTYSLTLPAKSVIVRIPGELTNIVGGYVREEDGKEPLVDAVVLAGCFKLYGGIE